MKKIVFFILVLTVLYPAYAQSYSEQFQTALDAHDAKTQRAILHDWQTAAPEDIDLYIARWNYYVNAYMGEHSGADLSELKKSILDSGFAVIDAAIERYPNRLDLRFGKIYFLGQITQWDSFVAEILHTIDHSNRIAHKWTFNNLTDEGEALMVEGIQDYQSDMYATIADKHHLSAADSLMVVRIRRVAQRTIQVFPDNVDAMNMLAVSYILVEDYEKSIKYLLRAENIAPTHPAILRNLIESYTRLNKKKEAATYQARLDALPMSDRY